MTREEAIETIRRCCPKVGDSQCDFESAMRELIPELAESDDERVRKGLIEALKTSKIVGELKFILPEPTREECIAYLEKQKEQKHYWKPTETDVALFNKAVTTNKALTPAERAQLDIIRSKFGCCRAVNCSGIVQKEQKHPDGCFTCDEYKKGYEAGRLNGFTAGYNKAMKEQNPAEWSEEDETKLRDVVRLVEDSGHVKSIREHYEKFLTSLPERFNLCLEQEWSEEDEEMRNLIITIFEVNHPDGFFKANELGTTDMRGVHTEEIISWLKSLRPQPKQEWSEEDERNLCRAIFYVIGYQKNNGVTNETKECKDWLEFLRLRSRWKPSKEQIDLLRKVYNLIWADPATPADIQDGLGDFIEQLKTL